MYKLPEITDGGKVPYHQIVRTYSSHYTSKTLWKVLSRPMIFYHQAEEQLEWFISQEPKHAQKRHEFFIVIVYDEPWDNYHETIESWNELQQNR